MEGWIKIHRKILNSWIWKEKKYFNAWIYCLLRANYEDTTVQIGKKTMSVPRGSFITSIRKFSVQTGLTERETRTFFKRMKSDTVIDTKSAHQMTQVIICKYDDYQDERHSERHSLRHSERQQIKNKKEEKNKNPPIVPPRGDLNEESPENIFSRSVPENLDTPKFKVVWFEEWIPYRKEQKYKNPGYKERGLQAALSKLDKDSNGDPSKAIQIIRQSIALNYQGLFPIKGNGSWKPVGSRGAKKGKWDSYESEKVTIRR
jgi:hypothetical protein